MCGRFTVTLSAEEAKQTTGATMPSAYRARYNAAPGQRLPVLTDATPTQWQLYQWGLVPGWAKSASVGSRAINARLETVAEKPSFQFAFSHQRCVVLADSYYEWLGNGKTKTPYRILLPSKEPFYMAGLWEIWNKGKQPLYTFTILTRPAEGVAAEVHDRMPILLSLEKGKKWLNKKEDTSAIQEWLHTNTLTQLTRYAVSRAVGNIQNDTPNLILPSNEPIQGSLF